MALASTGNTGVSSSTRIARSSSHVVRPEKATSTTPRNCPPSKMARAQRARAVSALSHHRPQSCPRTSCGSSTTSSISAKSSGSRNSPLDQSVCPDAVVDRQGENFRLSAQEATRQRREQRSWSFMGVGWFVIGDPRLGGARRRLVVAAKRRGVRETTVRENVLGQTKNGDTPHFLAKGVGPRGFGGSSGPRPRRCEFAFAGPFGMV